MRIKHPNWEESISSKNWDEVHKKRTREIVEKFNPPKTPFFWLTLILTVFICIALALLIVPLLYFFSTPLLYFLIAGEGMIFGFWIYLLFQEYELKVHHHIITKVLLPLIAGIAVFVAVLFANSIAHSIENILPSHDPLPIVLIYIVSFVFPMAIAEYKIRKRVAAETSTKKA